MHVLMDTYICKSCEVNMNNVSCCFVRSAQNRPLNSMLKKIQIGSLLQMCAHFTSLPIMSLWMEPTPHLK